MRRQELGTRRTIGSLPTSVFVVLVLLVLARGLVWTVATPPFQAPDEPSHAGYAEHLYVDPDPFVGKVQLSGAMSIAANNALLNEVSHHPDYPGSLTDGDLEARRAAIERTPNSYRENQSGYYLAAAGYPPTYYYLGAATFAAVDHAGGSYLTQIQALRILSVVLATIAFAFQFGVLIELVGPGLRSFAGALLIAFMPMYGFISSAFNPDVLMALLMSAAVWAALRIRRLGMSRSRVALLVAATAIGLVTKPTAIVLVPLCLLVAVRALRAPAREQRRWRIAGTAVVGALCVLGPYLVFSRFDTSASEAGQLVARGKPITLDSLVDYARLFRQSFRNLYVSSFWGNFGWLDSSFQPWLYSFLIALGCIAGLGLLARCVTGRTWSARWLTALVPLLTLGLLLVSIEYISVRDAGGPSGLFIQGRYLFPLLPVLVALYVHGMTALERWPIIGRAVLAGSVALMFTFQLMTWVQLIGPRYSL